MNFEYREIFPLEQDKESYKQLHHELFKSAAIDDEWLEWYHKDICSADGHLSRTRTYGLFDGKRLIGIWSVEPKKFKNSDGKELKVGRCFAVGISGDYRRMGLFVSLSKYAIEQEKSIGEFEYIFGFPQTGRSVIGGHYKAGWKEVAMFDILSCDLISVDYQTSKCGTKDIIDFNNIEFCTSLNSFSETYLYKNIRYLKHPRLKYMLFQYNASYIILKYYSSFCHVVEMNGSVSDVSHLLQVCKSVAKSHGLEEINIWSSDIFRFRQSLLETGFRKGAKHGLPITFIAIPIHAVENFELSYEMNIGMGVEEGY